MTALDLSSEQSAESMAARLVAHYRLQWERDWPEMLDANTKLGIEAIGFSRCQGDWIGAVVTPWFLRLIMLPGGGSLWGDIPEGQRRYVELPGGTLPFIAESNPVLGCIQYSTLVTQISEVPDMEIARHTAIDALQAFAAWVPADVAPNTPETRVDSGVSRRGFFRRLAGKR